MFPHPRVNNRHMQGGRWERPVRICTRRLPRCTLHRSGGDRPSRSGSMRRTVWRVGVGLAATLWPRQPCRRRNRPRRASRSPARISPPVAGSPTARCSTASDARAATSRRRCPGAIPRRHPELRAADARSGRTDRQRLVALGRLQHPRQREFASRRRRRPAQEPAARGGRAGRTDFGTSGYGGPCPPPGKPHRYYLRLYALKVAKLDVPADATAAYIGFMARTQSLAKAELMGLYGR